MKILILIIVLVNFIGMSLIVENLLKEFLIFDF
jgi:hypothetical protein